MPGTVVPLSFDALYDPALTDVLVQSMHNANLILDPQVFLAEPSQQPYRLYAHIAMQLPPGSKVVDAIGASDSGATAAALSCNPSVCVVSDPGHLDAAVVVVEDIHTIQGLVSTPVFKGIIVWHAIHQNAHTTHMWKNVPRQHCDITNYGYHQGTGIVVCDATMYDIHFPVYRLGNMIDTWYARAFMPASEHERFQNARMIYFTYAKNTFAEYLGMHGPKHLPNQAPSALKDWWWMHYANFIDMHPHFTQSLRDAISNYRPSLPSPTTERTCVVHYRIGDYLKHGQVLPIDDIINAIDLLKIPPDRFEILSGGINHLTNDILRKQSVNVLEKLVRRIKIKCPSANVVQMEAKNPDDDFFRMVAAPMLLTGNSSFAIMAAAANENQRLTPSKLDLSKTGPSTPVHVFEGWTTYPVTV